MEESLECYPLFPPGLLTETKVLISGSIYKYAATGGADNVTHCYSFEYVLSF